MKKISVVIAALAVSYALGAAEFNAADLGRLAPEKVRRLKADAIVWIADGKGVHAEMFADITPGTPGIYRREALRKLYLAGFDVRPRTFWGSDGIVNDYDPEVVRGMLACDTAIIDEIDRDAAGGAIPAPYGMPKLENLKPALFAEAWRAFNS